jgi:hypothetical protein
MSTDAVTNAFLAAVDDLSSGQAKPVEEYLKLVHGPPREELADMLAAIFASRPAAEDAPNLDSPSYQRALAALDEVSERAGAAGLLPGALVELRATRGITPEQVVGELAEQLELPLSARGRLDWQYFRLESGQLPGAALSRRLLGALASIFGTLTEDLLAASEVPARAGTGRSAAPALARPAGTGSPPPTRSRSPAPEPNADTFEVDRLFTGGREG